MQRPPPLTLGDNSRVRVLREQLARVQRELQSLENTMTQQGVTVTPEMRERRRELHRLANEIQSELYRRTRETRGSIFS
tara:strand:+ start:903 stop:1139 length:237 start_codon:yes stop_codon:yes gene_type:complete